MADLEKSNSSFINNIANAETMSSKPDFGFWYQLIFAYLPLLGHQIAVWWLIFITKISYSNLFLVTAWNLVLVIVLMSLTIANFMRGRYRFSSSQALLIISLQFFVWIQNPLFLDYLGGLVSKTLLNDAELIAIDRHPKTLEFITSISLAILFGVVAFVSSALLLLNNLREIAERLMEQNLIGAIGFILIIVPPMLPFANIVPWWSLIFTGSIGLFLVMYRINIISRMILTTSFLLPYVFIFGFSQIWLLKDERLISREGKLWDSMIGYFIPVASNPLSFKFLSALFVFVIVLGLISLGISVSSEEVTTSSIQLILPIYLFGIASSLADSNYDSYLGEILGWLAFVSVQLICIALGMVWAKDLPKPNPSSKFGNLTLISFVLVPFAVVTLGGTLLVAAVLAHLSRSELRNQGNNLRGSGLTAYVLYGFYSSVITAPLTFPILLQQFFG